MTTTPPTGAAKTLETIEPAAKVGFSETTEAPNHKPAMPTRNRDWPLVVGIAGLIVALFTIAATAYFHLDTRIGQLDVKVDTRFDQFSARLDRLDARFDSLYELILSLKQ